MELKDKTLPIKLPPNPLRRAGLISKLLFLWTFPLFRKGYQRSLKEEDLYAVLEKDESKNLGDKLEGYWEQELERARKKKEKKKGNSIETKSAKLLLPALIKMSWKRVVCVTVACFINQCVFTVAQPIVLQKLIQTFEHGNHELEAEKWNRYIFAGIITTLAFLHTLITEHSFYQLTYLALKIRMATSTLIFRKSLRVTQAANVANTGQIVNLMANDCARFYPNIALLPFVFVAPIQLIILTYLLYEQVGLACFGGVGLILLLEPVQYLLGKFAAMIRFEIAKRTDERGRLMNEIIAGMQTIKTYAWEKPFANLVEKVRRMEMKKIRNRGLLNGLQYEIFKMAPQLARYITFVIFLLIEGKSVSASKIFFVLTCLHSMIEISLMLAPLGISGLLEMLVAIQRIQDYLMLEEQTDSSPANQAQVLYSSTKKEDGVKETVIINNNLISKLKDSFTRISMENACASWTKNDDDTGGRMTLDNVTLSVEGHMLVMVVGGVGSGKTSLLHTILNELPISSGNLKVSGNVSFASQEPWLFTGNVRENVLFGLAYDEGRYVQTLSVCALDKDLEQLPYGDMTIVGERGVSLSGGQKARVNLARALYRKADIYLLDDPLSAVDTRVGRHLFEKCIMEHLQGSLRILVTHQLQYLPQADYILVLDQGKVLAQGTFEDVRNSGLDFMSKVEDINDDEPKIVDIHGENICKLVDRKEGPDRIAEDKLHGCVTGRTYWDFFMAGHTLFGFFSLLLFFIVYQLFSSGSDVWLSYWTNSEAKRDIIFHAEGINKTTSAIYKYHSADEDMYYLLVYTGFTAAVVLVGLFRGPWFYYYCYKISINLHSRMLQCLMRAPIKFFNDNPSGRIMNRFIKDISIVDEMLPLTFIDAITIFFRVVGVLCVVIISNYYMSLPAIVLLVALYYIRRICMETTRYLRRTELTTRSPIFSHVATTTRGLGTIRASKSQDILMRQFEAHQDIHAASSFLFIGSAICFGIWLELVSDIFLGLVSFSFLLASNSQEAGNVGLAISSMLTLMSTLQWGMRQSAEAENYMTSVERVLEYSKLTPEAELNSKVETKPTSSTKWPSMGLIEFVKVFLSYDKQENNFVLKNLSFTIKPSEKIGIVGRTGAGKSSIITSLFRLTEPDGDILIDSVSVKTVGLHDLRKNISIIPQDPVLFSGSIRYNLDPFGQSDDHNLWKVIEEVELKDAVPSLDYQVTDGGANFSVGQRQLVCLARAILRKNKILVMDEATANVDPRTDHLIQKTIRSKFTDCTILTIAHRLDSIIDCDRILVLDQGQLKEYDHAHVLLQNKKGIFSGMVAQTGHSTSIMLTKLASEAFAAKCNSQC